MWNLSSFRLETVLVSGKMGALFTPNVPSAQKSFWTHPIVPQVDGAQVEGRFGPFGHSANHDAR